MSDDENNADKPYEASHRKLEDARKRGEIARSQDALTLVHLAGFLLALYILFGNVIWPLTLDMLRHVQLGFQRAPDQGFGGDLSQSVLWIAKIALMVFLIPFSLILAALVASRQIVVAGEKIRPKLSRISVVANFRKKFGLAGFVEFFKSLAKAIVFAAILSLWFSDSFRRFDLSVALEANAMLANLLDLALAWLWQILAVYVVFAGVDILWQRHEHAKKNRMSHKEMKDEHKNEEGDETIRQQRRAKAQEIATNRMLLDVPGSTVVIVNPTHYAVALKWTGGKNEVPRCVAKGVDETAFRIREIALTSGVPLYSDPPTARELHGSVKLGEEIRLDHYKAVAIAMGHARRVQKMARRR